jgi:hypothetical protein
MSNDLEQQMQISGRYGVVLGSDYPSPDQLNAFMDIGWRCLAICPGFAGSSNVPAGQVALYFERMHS